MGLDGAWRAERWTSSPGRARSRGEVRSDRKVSRIRGPSAGKGRIVRGPRNQATGVRPASSSSRDTSSTRSAGSSSRHSRPAAQAPPLAGGVAGRAAKHAQATRLHRKRPPARLAGGTEDGRDRRPDRRGEVRGAALVGDEQVGSFEDRDQLRERPARERGPRGGGLEGTFGGGAHGLRPLPVARDADDQHPRVTLPGQRRGHRAEALRRPAPPGDARRGVQDHERAAGVGKGRTNLRVDRGTLPRSGAQPHRCRPGVAGVATDRREQAGVAVEEVLARVSRIGRIDPPGVRARPAGLPEAHPVPRPPAGGPDDHAGPHAAREVDHRVVAAGGQLRQQLRHPRKVRPLVAEAVALRRHLQHPTHAVHPAGQRRVPRIHQQVHARVEVPPQRRHHRQREHGVAQVVVGLHHQHPPKRRAQRGVEPRGSQGGGFPLGGGRSDGGRSDRHGVDRTTGRGAWRLRTKSPDAASRAGALMGQAGLEPATSPLSGVRLTN